MALFLAAVLAAGTLSGCGGSAAGGSSGGTSKAVASTEPTTLRVMGIDTASTVEGQEIYLSDWVNGDSELWKRLTDDLAKKRIKLNVTLVKSDQYDTVLQTQVAAGLNYDMVNFSDMDKKTLLTMAEQGKFLVINDLWENHSDGTAKKFFTEGNGEIIDKYNTLKDGKLYWINGFTLGKYKDIETGSPVSFMIRNDWLDQLDLPVPKTTDELYDTLVAFQQKDVNGSGKKDEILSFDINNLFNTGISQWFGLGNGILYQKKASEKVQCFWYQDNAKPYIQYMNKLYKAGLLDTSGQGSQKSAENKVSGLCDWSLETWYAQTAKVPTGAPMAYYLPITATAIKGQDPCVLLQNGRQDYGVPYAFTKQCNPDAAGRLLDYLVSEDYTDLSENGIEGVNYKKNSDGSIIKIQGDTPERKLKYAVPALWCNSGIFPRYEYRDRALELEQTTDAGKSLGYPETGYQGKSDFAAKAYQSKNIIQMSISGAYPTTEQVDKISEIDRDLNTYSSELLTKLILGQKSLDNWDTYIKDLKRLGLDERISIEQDLVDRYNKQ